MSEPRWETVDEFLAALRVEGAITFRTTAPGRSTCSRCGTEVADTEAQAHVRAHYDEEPS
jgi:hypothetical protein